MNTLHDQLVEATRRLAASPEEQGRFLQEFGTYPSADELALMFHDLALIAERLATQRQITSAALAAIKVLDAELGSFSGERYASEWQASALGTSPRWARVRVLADGV